MNCGQKLRVMDVHMNIKTEILSLAKRVWVIEMSEIEV